MARGDHEEELGRGCFALLVMLMVMFCALMAFIANTFDF